jgi:hypothetical protein
MDKEIRFILCIITTILIIISEKGVPVRFTKWDILIYTFVFGILLGICKLF